MTNLQLTVMIAAYIGNKDFDPYDVTTQTSYQKQTQDLLTDEMIEPSPTNYKYRATEKGKYWLEAVLKTPYPMQITEWRMPNV